jgi:transglutaminase-like putative cysteine protease
MNKGTRYLHPSATVDSQHPKVVEYARDHVAGLHEPTEQAVKLYYAIRDGFRYDPYTLQVSVEGLRASTTLDNGYGWCVAKAVLLAACCRAISVPARLGFADVKNHLSTERMRSSMGTEIFYWHGYTSIFLADTWVKATPAFNIELCEKFRIRPLDFDGREDSIYHTYNLDGDLHMEYVNLRGEFEDVPIEEMMETFREKYPELSEEWVQGATFDADVEREVVSR